MAEELNAGNLFVEIGAKTAKLDAELKKAQAELDALERSDPLVDVMVEIEDARQIEQELDRKIAQIDAQPIDVEVNIDKPNNIGGAGKQIELFQQQLSKVLGIAAGITAGVALFGGIAKGAREASESTGVLADETKKAQGAFRTFSQNVPVIGQLGIALQDVAIAIGTIEDGARKAAIEAAALDQSLRLEASRRALGRLGQDLDLLIQEMSRFDEAGTAAFDLEMFEKGLDPVLRQLEDSRQQIIDAQRANLDELRKFATADTMNAASASGMVFDVPEDQEFLYERLMKERKELQQELFEFNRKNEEAIAARRAQLQDAVLREEMEEQQRIAAQEQADIEAAAALQAKEDAEFDKRMQERNANRMRAYEVEQEMLEEAKKKEEQRLAIVKKIALASVGINKATLDGLKKERDEIKKAGAERLATRKRLGETEGIETAIGSFTIGRTFAPGDTVEMIEEQTKKSVESIDKKVSNLEKILKRIEQKTGGSNNGAFT